MSRMPSTGAMTSISVVFDPSDQTITTTYHMLFEEDYVYVQNVDLERKVAVEIKFDGGVCLLPEKEDA